MESQSPKAVGSSPKETLRWVTVIFFLSGFSALSYEIVWQRSLFSIYGINIESVTIIVTAFMVGLGFGSLVGGAMSTTRRWSKVALFAACETFIGLYGACSLPLIRAVGDATVEAPEAGVFVLTFLLVLIPTLAMGATMPLLVANLVAAEGNVGRAVSTLYYVNTLGSAFASLLCATFLLGALGQQKTVWLAAAINVAVGTMALWLERSRPSAPAARAPEAS